MGLSRKELIYGAVTFVSLLAAIAKLAYFDGAQRGLQGLVFAIAYLAFVGWAGTELWSIRAQETEDSTEQTSGAPELLVSTGNRPSEDALISAEVYLSMGERLDTICRYVEPQYTEWTPSERLRYRQGLRAALDERRSASPPEQTADG